MPPLSADDYHKLLQKIAVLETKIHRLEVNVEVNGLGGNDTTLPLAQINGQELASTRLTSTDKATTKQVGSVLINKSTSSSPPWNHLGAKPKNKSFPWAMGGRLTGRAQRAEVCDETGWPALPPRQSASSTPVPGRRQPWKTVEGRMSNKPPKQSSIELQNRYSPLMKDTEFPSDHPSSVGLNDMDKISYLDIHARYLDMIRYMRGNDQQLMLAPACYTVSLTLAVVLRLQVYIHVCD